MKFILGLMIGSRESPASAPPPLLGAVQRVQVTQGDGGRPGDYQQGFELSLAAGRGPGATSEYALLATPLLDPGSRVIVSVTLNAVPHVLFDGIIAHRQLAPGGASDPPVLTVMGRDLSLLMDLEDQEMDYPGQEDEDIAGSILKRYASYGIKPQVSSPKTSWAAEEDERVARQLCTDRAYLQRLAARHGFIFRVIPGPRPGQCSGYWGPVEYDQPPRKALTVNMGAATNVQAIRFEEDALAPAHVFGAAFNAQDEEPITLSTETSSQATALAKHPRLTADAAFVRKRRMAYAGTSAVAAEALAQALTDRSTDSVVRINGSLDTLEYGGILVSPGRVCLRGAGMRHDGDYSIRKVTHDITPGQYLQHFELAREGLGSLIQTV
jgi:hypothetical protein